MLPLLLPVSVAVGPISPRCWPLVTCLLGENSHSARFWCRVLASFVATLWARSPISSALPASAAIPLSVITPVVLVAVSASSTTTSTTTVVTSDPLSVVVALPLVRAFRVPSTRVGILPPALGSATRAVVAVPVGLVCCIGMDWLHLLGFLSVSPELSLGLFSCRASIPALL